VSHPCNKRVSPKEWMEARACLWDFVGDERRLCSIRTPEQANSCSFMRVLGCEFLVTCWHTVCSPSTATLSKKIGFPGWPDPNLDWVSGFGGSVLRKKGACTSPLFHFSNCVFRVVSRQIPWVVSVLQGAKHRAHLASLLYKLNSRQKIRLNADTHRRYWRRCVSNHASVRAMTSRWCLGLAKRWPSRSYTTNWVSTPSVLRACQNS